MREDCINRAFWDASSTIDTLFWIDDQNVAVPVSTNVANGDVIKTIDGTDLHASSVVSPDTGRRCNMWHYYFPLMTSMAASAKSCGRRLPISATIEV